MRSTTVFGTALSATIATAQNNGAYVLKDDLSYNNFFPNFDFFSGPDPTNGFVQYQAKDAAIQNQYVGYFEDEQSIFLGVDYKNKDPRGRASVRIESTKTWNKGLMIADIKHMPDNRCGTWPAFWTLGQQNAGTDDWPKGGEIDILEGVNLDTAAAVTLHTSAGCAVDNATSSLIQGRAEAGTAAFMGSMSTSNCDVAAENQGKNVGCSIKAQNGTSTYGTEFNAAGGGVYAMEWTSTSITVWFFSRSSDSFKTTFGTNNTSTLDTSTFGTPLAKFQGQGCDFEERFKNMRIIFDTTFCGDWAGKEWEKSTCAATTGAKTCQEYVQNNPEAFANAYWEIKGLKWFEKSEGGQAPAGSQPPVASSAPVSSSLAPAVPVPTDQPAFEPTPYIPTGSVPVPSVPVSSPSAPVAPVASVAPAASVSAPAAAVNPTSSPIASSSAAPAPIAGTGAGAALSAFVFPTVHIGGTNNSSAPTGAAKLASYPVAGSSSSICTSDIASSPIAGSPGAATSAAASSPVAGVPPSSSTGDVASPPIAGSPPSVAPSATASAPIASSPPSAATSSSPIAVSPPSAATSAIASSPITSPSTAPTPTAGAGAGAGPGAGSSLSDFVFPTAHISGTRKRAHEERARRLGRSFRA